MYLHKIISIYNIYIFFIIVSDICSEYFFLQIIKSIKMLENKDKKGIYIHTYIYIYNFLNQINLKG